MTDKLPPLLRRRPVQIALAVVCVALLALWISRPARDDAATAYHEVRRGDFTISVVEGGTLGAVSEVVVRSEVEGTARIISIVPEGSYVRRGDLLVELDSSQAQDQVNQQLINLEKARFAVTNAQAQIEIAASATNSDFLQATLRLDLAKLDLEKYLQGQKLVDLIEASNKVIQASNTLVVNLETYSNSVALATKGYETKQKLDSDRLAVQANRNALTVATNGIWMLEAFDIRKQVARFESDVEQAEQELKRVISQNERKMLQYEADLRAQMNTLKLSEDKLARDQRNLTNTIIRAPQDGLVVYQVSEGRFSSESLIEGGAVVRNRQDLIKLPDLSRMKVVVKVHESHVDMVRPGLPAFVVLATMPDQQFRGVVEKVAPLPDTQMRWANPNLKVYNTEIYLTDSVTNVKPGISAQAEIIITNLADTLSVPVQAVTAHKGKQVVYVANGGKAEPRPVEVGMFNTKHIQVLQGLKEGERVLLSPPFDVQEKDLDGAVLADTEKAKLATNVVVPRAPAASGQAMVARSPGASVTAPGAAPPNNQLANADGPGEGTMAARGDQGGGRRRGGFNREEMMKQFDKNGDGEIDESEREAMQAAMAARFGGQGGPGGFGAGGGTNAPGRHGGFNREEMLKRFDANGDGEIDETERAAMRQAMGGGRTNRTERRGDGEGGPGGFRPGDRANGPEAARE